MCWTMLLGPAKTIKRFMKPAYMTWMKFINKPLRLSHAYNFIKLSMKKHIQKVQLEDNQFMMKSNSKKYPNCLHFSNRTKGLIIVNIVLMIIPLSNKSFLVCDNRSIWMIFYFVDPMRTQYIGIRGGDK